MKNKHLELRLEKAGHLDVIELLEKCENKKVLELMITSKRGITRNPVLDRMVVTYLKKLKIKVVFSQEESTSKNSITSKIRKEKEKDSCQSKVHELAVGKGKKKDKVKQFDELKYDMFKLGPDSFVVCSDCTSLIKFS